MLGQFYDRLASRLPLAHGYAPMGRSSTQEWERMIEEDLNQANERMGLLSVTKPANIKNTAHNASSGISMPHSHKTKVAPEQTGEVYPMHKKKPSLNSFLRQNDAFLMPVVNPSGGPRLDHGVDSEDSEATEAHQLLSKASGPQAGFPTTRTLAPAPKSLSRWKSSWGLGGASRRLKHTAASGTDLAQTLADLGVSAPYDSPAVRHAAQNAFALALQHTNNLGQAKRAAAAAATAAYIMTQATGVESTATSTTGLPSSSLGYDSSLSCTMGAPETFGMDRAENVSAHSLSAACQQPLMSSY
ncbi:hypothetical protein H4R34_000491 [Dimargaris verticillata]|uniref:Uncharacterized protein n=1 Tax=Dimargaris verticillata TaxID=2761393 RepID=A0A9W8BAB7_9FUNG|nr:hypothetical protein H4R34_000491 [Dimargaris verticillata]